MYFLSIFPDLLLLVAAGSNNNGGGYNAMEFISLNPIDYPVPSTLQNDKSLPPNKWFVGGAYLRATGSSKNEIYMTCGSGWRYSMEKDKWFESGGKMNSKVHSAFAFHRETSRLYVTGGRDIQYNPDTLMGPTQFTEDGSIVHSLPDMPHVPHMPIAGHCMSVLKGGNIFVAGGWCEDSKFCFLFNNATNEWKRGPDMTVEGRRCASWGVITTRDGKEEVVVAGGYNDENGHYDSVQIFSVQESSWRSGEKKSSFFNKS
jgi:hypothetical protein